MPDTYDVLMADGTVRQFRAGQFEELRRVRSAKERNALVTEGWMALDEEIEQGEAPKQPVALEQALTESVVAPPEPPPVTVYVLGRLKAGEAGEQVV